MFCRTCVSLIRTLTLSCMGRPGRHMRGSGHTPLEDLGRQNGITSTSGCHVSSPCMAVQSLGQLSSRSFSVNLMTRASQSRDVWPIPFWVDRQPPWIQGSLGMSAVPLMTRECREQQTPWPMPPECGIFLPAAPPRYIHHPISPILALSSPSLPCTSRRIGPRQRRDSVSFLD